MEQAPCPTSDGALHVRVTKDLELDGGTWKLTEDQKGRPIARITPPVAPMFQQVIEYLETKPVPPDGNIRREEEARAAVAVCLRWGSYFALLADPSRPVASDIDDDQISQIDDEEMARMNIEISAALAWWLTLRGADEGRYWDIVHRSLAYLPCGPKTIRSLERGDILLVCTTPELATQVRNSWPTDRLDRDLSAAGIYGIRILANTITHLAWRNGPVEKVHAGRFEGYALGNCRVPTKDEKAIIRQAQGGFYTGLKATDFLKYNDAWPPPAERVLPFMHGLVGPSRWSLTEESRAIEVALRDKG